MHGQGILQAGQMQKAAAAPAQPYLRAPSRARHLDLIATTVPTHACQLLLQQRHNEDS